MSDRITAIEWGSVRLQAGPWVWKALEACRDARSSIAKLLGVVAARGVRRVGAPLERSPGEALFLWLAEDAEADVRLAGDWTGWRPDVVLERMGQSGIFAARVSLPLDAFVGYKFVVDGVWRFDPLNSGTVGAGMGLRNSLLTMPGFEVPPCLGGELPDARGLIEDLGVLPAKGLPGGRRVRVYLPPGYSEDGEYDTLYVQDGEENFGRGSVPAALDRMVRAGFSPVIAVFIDHPGAERHLDYTPYFEGSRLDAYGAWLAEALVPVIEDRFSAARDRRRRVVWGQSFGGTCALSVLHAHPDIFGRAAGQSGVYRWHEGPAVADRFTTALPDDTRIYLDSTHFSMEPAQSQTMADALQAIGARHVYWRRGTNHSYEGWRFWLPSMFDALLTRP